MARKLNTRLLVLILLFVVVPASIIGGVIVYGILSGGGPFVLLTAGDPVVLAKEAQDAFDAKQYTEAWLKIRDCMKAGGGKVPENQYLLSQIALKLKPVAFQTAVNALKTAIVLKPGYLEAQRDLTELYLAAHYWKETREAVDKLIALDPTLGKAYLWGAAAELGQADVEPIKANRRPYYEAAIKRCEEGIKNSPTTLQLYQLQAQISSVMEMPEKIVPILDLAIANNPKVAAAYTTKAEYLMATGDVKAAEEVLAQGLAKVPDDPQILLTLGDTLLRENTEAGRQKARELFIKVIAADPTSEAGYLRLCSLYRTTGQPDEALKILKSAMDKIPGSVSLMAEQADIYMDQREFTKADEVMAALEKTDAQAGVVLFLKGKRAFVARQVRQAIAYLEQAREKIPGSPHVMLLLGRAYLLSDELGAADKVLRELLDRFPTISSGWRALVEVQLRLNNLEQAEMSGRRAVAVDPTDPDMHILYAQALEGLKRYPDALRESKAAEALAKDMPNPYLLTAEIYTKMNRRAEADASFRQAVKTNKDLGRVYELFGAFYKNGGQSEKIEPLLAEAKKVLAPEEYMLLVAVLRGSTTELEGELKARYDKGTATSSERNSLARIYLANNQPDKARELYEQTLQKAPTDSAEWSEAWQQLFVDSLSSEAYTKTAELVERLKKVNPTAPELLFANVLITLAKGKTDDAEKELRAIIDIPANRNISQGHFLLGQILARQRKFDAAVDEITKSLEIKPSQPGGWVLLARIYMMQARYDDARVAADQAVKYEPRSTAAMDVKAQALTAQARYPQALKTREDIDAIARDDIGNLMTMASLQLQLQQQEKAEALFARAYKIKPDDAVLVRTYAEFLADTGKPQMAAEIVDAYLEKHKPEAGAWVVRGEVTARLTGLADAEKYYTKAAELAPKDAYPYILLGDQFTRVQDWKNSARAYLLAVDRAKDTPDATAQKRLADVYMLDNKVAEAQSVIDAVLKKHPDDAAAFVISGRIAGRMNNAEKAYQQYQQALKIQPDYGEAKVRMAELYAGPDPMRAVELLKQVEATDASFEKAMLLMADIDTRRGLTQEAILDYRKLLFSRPISLAGRIGLAAVYMKAGDYTHAIEIYAALSKERADKDVSLLTVLGDAYLRQGKFNEAIGYYRKAAVIMPTSLDALIGEARCLVSLNRAKEAVDLCYKKLNEDATALWPRLALASVYEATKEPEKAAEVISTGLSTNPKWEEGYIRKAEILSRIPNRAVEGRAVMLQGLEANPMSISIRTNLGLADLGFGQPAEAIKAVEPLTAVFLKEYGTTPDAIQKLRPYMAGVGIHALALYKLNKPKDAIALGMKLWDVDPMDIINSNNMAWVQATEEKNYAKAEDMVTRCLRMMPNHPQILDTAGWIAFLMKDYDKAMDRLQAAVKYGPDVPDAHYHLGRLYEELPQGARVPEAIAEYKLAIEKGLRAPDKDEAQGRLKKLESAAK